MADRRIAAQRYDFTPEDIEGVLERFRELLEARAFLTMGQYGEEFEDRFRELCGTRHAVAVSSGTAALEIILRAIGVAGGEVIVPTNTSAASAFAVIHAGGIPVFADCGADLNVDPDDVEERLGPRTKAVMSVHLGGLVSPGVKQLADLCRTRGLPLVEDAAHAHGSRLDARVAGTFGDAGAFSFFSTKVLTTGEGGMIVTDRDDIAAAARLLRDQAKVAGANRHEQIGYNWRLTEVQAILGLAQLQRLHEFVEERRRVAAVYDSVLMEAPGLERLATPEGAAPNYYKYVLFVRGGDVQPIAKGLREQFGVALGGFVYELPCHEQPAFEEWSRGPLPNAEELCRRHICPPIYPSLSDTDARYVAESLLEVAA